MKQEFMTEVVQAMLPHLSNAQVEVLQTVLREKLWDKDIVPRDKEQSSSHDEIDFTERFLSAKRIEGCSEKSLKYYRVTIETMLRAVGKGVKHIVTDDLRTYLSDYQAKKHSSRTTIDNIRRILSSFFSWLEDEDYIMKSPVRRIHKVKTTASIKETYSDESLEIMRDNCVTKRDLAMVDMLASTGMKWCV